MPESHRPTRSYNHSDVKQIVGRGSRSSNSSGIRKVSMASTNGYAASKTEVKSASFLPPVAARRRQRLSKTKSVLVTVGFVIIFTCIIAMEVFYIDESKRFDKPQMIESNVVEDGVQESPLVADDVAAAAANDESASHISGTPNQVDLDIIRSPIWSRADNQSSFLKMSPERTILASGGIAAAPPGAVGGDEHEAMTANRTTFPFPLVEGNWQPVLGTQDKFFVYSAYFDDRQGSFIRVLAATRTRGSDRVHCAYWYDSKDGGTSGGDRSDPIIVSANNKVIRENWNLKYSATFVLCPLFLYNVGRKVAVPDHVSIVVSKYGDTGSTQSGPSSKDYEVSLSTVSAGVGNRLRVLNRKSDRDADVVEAFAVCVKPFHYNFNHAMQLIEFIELNRILGVTHFTFYNHTIGPEVDCVLREYIRQGIVTLLPWQLDMVTQKEIRTEGLFAAINDCLYRNMYRYRYVLMIDIDEFIVPHRNGTLSAVMREATRTIDTIKAGSFSFMNSFHYLQWPNDPNSRELPVPLITLQKTKRRAKFHPHKQRSKCIVVSRNVVEMGNHFVWEFLPGKGAVNVSPDIAYLHHYRVCEFGGDDCIKTQSVVDRTIYRYKADLVRSVVHALNISRTTGTEECQRRDYEEHTR